MDNKEFTNVFNAMWNNLTDEQRSLLTQKQMKDAGKAVARAKKESTKRMLDKRDRDAAMSLLKKAKCDTKGLSLNSIRTLALRWILSDADCRKAFALHVKELQGTEPDSTTSDVSK